MKVKFKNWDCELVRLGSYENGNIALGLVDVKDDYPVATCTVNVPELDPIPYPKILIKNYSENQGMMIALIKAKVIENTVFYQPVGAHGAQAFICELTNEAKAFLFTREEIQKLFELDHIERNTNNYTLTSFDGFDEQVLEIKTKLGILAHNYLRSGNPNRFSPRYINLDADIRYYDSLTNTTKIGFRSTQGIPWNKIEVNFPGHIVHVDSDIWGHFKKLRNDYYRAFFPELDLR